MVGIGMLDDLHAVSAQHVEKAAGIADCRNGVHGRAGEAFEPAAQ